MTASAWIMLVVTWLVITGCAGWFLLAVLRSPGAEAVEKEPDA